MELAFIGSVLAVAAVLMLIVRFVATGQKDGGSVVDDLLQAVDNFAKELQPVDGSDEGASVNTPRGTAISPVFDDAEDEDDDVEEYPEDADDDEEEEGPSVSAEEENEDDYDVASIAARIRDRRRQQPTAMGPK